MAEESELMIYKFDGTNFGFWKVQIEDLLYKKKLHQPLSGKKPESAKPKDWSLMDQQAFMLGAIIAHEKCCIQYDE